MFFAQRHEPGRLGLSDFTHATELEVHIGGARLEHRLYQFALAYSGWRHVEIVLGGESFVALSSGLQNALWQLGGAPHEHRTDSLSAAFRNLAEREDLTRRYEWLCAHYGMAASRNNRGASHENGSIEARHGTLKHFARPGAAAARQPRVRHAGRVSALPGRGDRRAPTAASPRRWRSNGPACSRCRRGAPPSTRRSMRGSPSSRLFTVRGVLYSAPSRLIGHRLKVRVYAERIEAISGRECACSKRHGLAAAGQRTSIDFRHLLPALKRKPGALVRWRMRDALFPRTEYRDTWRRLIERLPEARAARIMVGLLELAPARLRSRRSPTGSASSPMRDELPDLDRAARRVRATRRRSMPTVHGASAAARCLRRLVGACHERRHAPRRTPRACRSCSPSCACRRSSGCGPISPRSPTVRAGAPSGCSRCCSSTRWPSARRAGSPAIVPNRICRPTSRSTASTSPPCPASPRPTSPRSSRATAGSNRAPTCCCSAHRASGKSHLIAAIGHGLIDRGWRVLFTRTGDLVQRLQAARRDLRLPAELARLDRFDLLILDDFSYVRRDQAESSVLFELICRALRAQEHRTSPPTSRSPPGTRCSRKPR